MAMMCAVITLVVIILRNKKQTPIPRSEASILDTTEGDGNAHRARLP